ncbi:hypothetical protein FRC02_006629 [Tulasnella sp. 418]|nr:hypothetical protein FRC02_006629 [Tulasnella sp. 418]
MVYLGLWGTKSGSERCVCDFHRWNTAKRVVDWIPTYLQTRTKLALRGEISKELSSSDGPGFFYCLEVIDKTTSSHMCFKIGRTRKINNRPDDYTDCGPPTPELVCYFPPGPLAEGLRSPDAKVSWINRLERLIHIELGDISLNSTHLLPGFDPTDPRSHVKPDASQLAAKTLGIHKPKQCQCGVKHREIFKFELNSNDGRQYVEMVIKPVIRRWIEFVQLRWGDV